MPPTPRQRVIRIPRHPDLDRVLPLALPKLQRLLLGCHYPQCAIDDTARAAVNVTLWARDGGLEPEPAEMPEPEKLPTDLADRCVGGGA